MSEAVKKETPEQQEFRQHCRDWLAKNNPPVPAFRMPKFAIEIMTQEQIDYSCAWEKAAYEAGLVGCDYPKEVGGGGRENFINHSHGEVRSTTKKPPSRGSNGQGHGLERAC